VPHMLVSLSFQILQCNPSSPLITSQPNGGKPSITQFVHHASSASIRIPNVDGMQAPRSI